MDVFAEELTIRETRRYVKRVLKTYGIYRWLYSGASPQLPIGKIPESPDKTRRGGVKSPNSHGRL